MMTPESLTELASDYQRAAAQYQARREEAESAAVEWRWASGPLFSLELLQFERGGHRRGRWLRKEAKGNSDRCQYGLDSAGRVVVERRAILGSDEHQAETFVRYGNDLVESVQFGSTPNTPIEMLVRQSIEEGLPRTCRWYAPHQRGFDTYRYVGGQLHEIDSLWSNDPHRDEDLLSAIFRCEYDADGALSLLTVNYRKVGRHPGGTFTCYRLKRPAGGQS